MSKWFIVRRDLSSRSSTVVEQDSVGEDGEYILFPCTCEDKSYCPDGLHKVHKAYVGVNYFHTREAADERVEILSSGLIEPSDADRAQWSDVTRSYVERLEKFYDANVRTQL